MLVETRFKLSNKSITLVFDRGIVCEDDAVLIEDAEMKYVSALNRNEIPSSGTSLGSFKGLTVKKATGNVPAPEGFKDTIGKVE